MDVEADLALLAIEEEQQKSTSVVPSASEVRRSGRKRIRPLPPQQKDIVTRSKKFLCESSTERQVEQYYLNTKVKLTSPALETIFEEPKNDAQFMSNKRLKRMIQFSGSVYEPTDKSKVKKRSLKARKIIKGGLKKLGKKLGLESLMKTLKKLEDEPPESATVNFVNVEFNLNVHTTV